MSITGKSAEKSRLEDNSANEVPLEEWGPYLSERQWGTVREDYSANGDAWNYFSFDDSKSRAYRWGEDGLAGISDYHQNICFAIALWNGKDPILKEKLYGLTNSQGNHGEDVKELYYYLDNVPSHSYMRFLYKYPQETFPYQDLLNEAQTRTRLQPEFELLDTGLLNENKYFDVEVIYAKNNRRDICIKIKITNRGSEGAGLVLLPTLWLRNQWSWGGDISLKPAIHLNNGFASVNSKWMETYYFYFQPAAETLMTENNTNTEKLFNQPNKSPFVKDAFHTAIAGKDSDLREGLNQNKKGTKFAPLYQLHIAAGESVEVSCRISATQQDSPFGPAFYDLFDKRRQEADEYYEELMPMGSEED